jgi:hypothetical protein
MHLLLRRGLHAVACTVPCRRHEPSHANLCMKTNLYMLVCFHSHEREDDGGGVRKVGQRLVRDVRRGGYVDVRGKRWDGQRDAARQRTGTTHQGSICTTCDFMFLKNTHEQHMSVECIGAVHEATADIHASGLRPAFAKYAGTRGQDQQQSVCRAVARHAMKSRLQHALLTIMLKLCSLKRVPPNKKQQPVMRHHC